MELTPRQVVFVKQEMSDIENDETRQPTDQVEAGRIRQEAENILTK